MANYRYPPTGYIGEEPKIKAQEVMIINDKAHRIHNIVVHRFSVTEMDDPDIHAAEPMYNWQKSEAGQWIMKHAIEAPMWHRQSNAKNWCMDYAVTAKLKDVDNTFWQLKWGS